LHILLFIYIQKWQTTLPKQPREEEEVMVVVMVTSAVGSAVVVVVVVVVGAGGGIDEVTVVLVVVAMQGRRASGSPSPSLVVWSRMEKSSPWRRFICSVYQ
jgi:hypothetical protein